jgi:hypothetical protein
MLLPEEQRMLFSASNVLMLTRPVKLGKPMEVGLIFNLMNPLNIFKIHTLIFFYCLKIHTLFDVRIKSVIKLRYFGPAPFPARYT